MPRITRPKTEKIIFSNALGKVRFTINSIITELEIIIKLNINIENTSFFRILLSLIE